MANPGLLGEAWARSNASSGRAGRTPWTACGAGCAACGEPRTDSNPKGSDLTGLINKKARRFGGPSLMARPEDYGGLSCPPPFGPAPKRRCSKSLPAILSNSADHNVGSSNVSGRLKQKAHLSVGFSYGAPGEIRTPDHLVRSQVLYPAELRARVKLQQSQSSPSLALPPARPQRCASCFACGPGHPSWVPVRSYRSEPLPRVHRAPVLRTGFITRLT